jgi:hypothetical protein
VGGGDGGHERADGAPAERTPRAMGAGDEDRRVAHWALVVSR